MEISSNFKHPLGCVLIFLFIWITISLQSVDPSIELIPEQVPKQEPFNETVSEKMDRKRKILERGCSMMAELFEMSQNGTSYESLLGWHARIHDLDYPLRRAFKMMFQGLIGEKSCFQYFVYSRSQISVLFNPYRMNRAENIESLLGIDQRTTNVINEFV